MVVPMIILVFAGVKMFLDNHQIMLPTLCLVVFILCFILLIKWNTQRLRGR
jgi:FtsH-binding integral membrane protein